MQKQTLNPWRSLLVGAALAFANFAPAAQAAREDSMPLASRRPRKTRSKVYIDRAGMPHGSSGDKAVRKAMRGTVGLTKPRGMYAAWHLTGQRVKPRRMP